MQDTYEAIRMHIVGRLLKDQRVRFLLVGGFNTMIGFGLFVVIELVIGRHTSYWVSLYSAYAFGVVISFLLHRRYTFQVAGTGHFFLDFIRFQSVSLVALAFNTIALPLLVELGQLAPILAQAIVVGITTVTSYIGHKFFSFKRPTPVVGERNGAAH